MASGVLCAEWKIRTLTEDVQWCVTLHGTAPPHLSYSGLLAGHRSQAKFFLQLQLLTEPGS